MDLGPVCGAGGGEHNLTYSYSSSDESLNESFIISFTQKPSRSAESSLKRRELRMSKNSKLFSQPVRSDSLVSSPQMQKMYSPLGQADRALELHPNIQTGQPRKFNVNSRETTLSRSTSSTTTSNSSLRSSHSQVPIQNLHQMGIILKKATKQSEDLSTMFK